MNYQYFLNVLRTRLEELNLPSDYVERKCSDEELKLMVLSYDEICKLLNEEMLENTITEIAKEYEKESSITNTTTITTIATTTAGFTFDSEPLAFEILPHTVVTDDLSAGVPANNTIAATATIAAIAPENRDAQTQMAETATKTIQIARPQKQIKRSEDTGTLSRTAIKGTATNTMIDGAAKSDKTASKTAVKKNVTAEDLTNPDYKKLFIVLLIITSPIIMIFGLLVYSFLIICNVILVVLILLVSTAFAAFVILFFGSAAIAMFYGVSSCITKNFYTGFFEIGLSLIILSVALVLGLLLYKLVKKVLNLLTGAISVLDRKTLLKTRNLFNNLLKGCANL